MIQTPLSEKTSDCHPGRASSSEKVWRLLSQSISLAWFLQSSILTKCLSYSIFLAIPDLDATSVGIGTPLICVILMLQCVTMNIPLIRSPSTTVKSISDVGGGLEGLFRSAIQKLLKS